MSNTGYMVRRGSTMDHHGQRYEINVRGVHWPDQGSRTFVAIEGPQRSIILATFDTHGVEAYGGSESDNRRVHLSALGCACDIAARLEQMEDFEFSAYLACIGA